MPLLQASRSCLKASPESCPQLFPAATPQSCAPKFFSKAVAPKLRFCKPNRQNGSPKHILQSGSRKLRPKIATESWFPKLLFFKAIVWQSCSGKLAKSVLPKPALQSCPPMRFPAAASQSCSPKHRRKAVAPKLLCFKPVPQSSSPKLFSKAAPESCCLKLPRKAAPQSCCYSPNLLHKAVPQSRSSKLLSKAAPNSCSSKLLKLPPKVVSESCFPVLLSKDTPQSCRSSKQLFFNAAAKPQSCSPQLLPKAVLQSCYRKPRPKEALQNSAHRLRKQAQLCGRRRAQQPAILAEVRVRKSTETIAQKLGKQGQ